MKIQAALFTLLFGTFSTLAVSEPRVPKLPSDANSPPAMAANFCLIQRWDSGGSTPPPNNRMFRLSTCANGIAELVLVAGFPEVFDDITRAKASKLVEPEKLAKLYGFVLEAAPNPWPPVPSAGYGACSFAVFEGSTRRTIPCNGPGDEIVRFHRSFFFPEEWKDLDSQLRNKQSNLKQ